jgi:Fe-S cluster assembly protein SufD
LCEVFVEDEAELDHLRLQQESANAYHLHSLHVAQSAASRYRHSTFSLGGAWARNEININFTGGDAHASLNGLYTAGGRQLNDVHVNIRHGMPGCESNTRFKGLLHGKGRAVFDGRILVERQAQHTEAHLNNANLMLTRDAEIDTKPQLEIYADDVICSHGATVGQLETEQLFYLRSRGISAEQAQRMLSMGFMRDILEQCRIDTLRDSVEQHLQRTLGAHTSIEDAPPTGATV